MAGRGRGRGRGSLVPTERRPGTISRDPLDQLSLMVRSMSLDADSAQLAAVTDLATKLTKEKQKAEQVTNVMYQRSKEDWHHSKSCVAICCNLTNLDDGTNSFRTSMLSTIKPDFDIKVELRKSDPERFLGNSAFLCQVYSQARDLNGQPYKVLTAPVLELILMCFDANATEEEMNCAAMQLFSVGHLVKKYGDQTIYTNAKHTIRDKILDSVGSPELRTILIQVMEGFASDWKLHSVST